MSAVLEQLRSETRALHEAVESTATMRAVTARPEDASAHGDYLTALAVAVRPLVNALLEHPGATAPRFLPDPDAWRRLDDDLVMLRRPRLASLVHSPPRTDDEGAWGRLYVVRGAEAGVTMLARRRAHADTGHVLPTTFASGIASRRADWPALCAALGELGPRAARRAAEVALADFQYVLASITRWEQRLQAAVD